MKLKDTLLLVGRCAETRRTLRSLFADTYNIIEAVGHEQGLFLYEQNINCIAAAILDIRPPKNRSKSLTVKLRQVPGGENVPIIILSEQADSASEIKGYEYGASDVISKPFNESTIFHRVQNLTELSIHRNQLEVLVEEQANIMRSTNETMVDVLSTIIEYRSIETGNHVMRIRQYTRVLLEKVMETYPEYNLTPEDISSVASASALHDIGKISIPDSILGKPGKLTDEEFAIMKTHTTNGAEILKNLNDVGDRKYLRYAYNICLYHHERWDGGGYPEGLVGDQIPICAQVAGIADVYDALTSDRVYKEAYSHNKAINMILNGKCGAFSPKVLECLKKVRSEFLRIHSDLQDTSPDEETGNSGDLTVPLPGPSYQLQKVDALQMVQVKYQTLLHHVNATVIEADLRSGVYHMVFNPDPDILIPGHKDSLYDALRYMIDTSVHPADKKDADELINTWRDAFTSRRHRKFVNAFRIYVPDVKDYVLYRVTVMHIYDNMPGSAGALIIIKPAASAASTYQAEHDTSRTVSPEHFSSLIGSTIVCDAGDKYKILQGAETLINLTGYTVAEIEEHFGNKLLEMLLDEDKSYIVRQIEEQLRHGNMLELEYRMKTKTGSLIWILDKSRLVEDENGKQYFYSVLIDNTRTKKMQEQLQSELDRNQLIINQSNDIIFELDIETNRLWCSSQWEERFGYRALSENYTEDIYKYSHIHPDDMPKMKEGISKLIGGVSHIALDVRIVNSEGIYSWNQIRATSKLDARGQVAKAIGVIVDIDQEVRSIRSLQEKSEVDALTGLYNKEATQRHITSLLAESTDDQRSALIIMDLDNFKSVNDTYGHLFGDNVLMQTARKIRKYFRSNDIIGRIGGDEFAVYVNGIKDNDAIESRCQLLIEMLSEMFRELLPDIQVSCSIGMAMVPDHGSSYVELFRKADQALYQAKRNGKECFAVYDDSLSVSAKNLVSAINDRIDSNEQPGAANNSLLYFLFQRLYESTDKFQTIQNIMSEVGRRLNVSRVYIFESNDERTEISNTFEWCNEGVTPEIDNLQNLNYIDGIVAGWHEVFNERGILYCTDISTLEPRFRDVLEPQGVKSLLQCAIYDGGEFRGFVGFDECTYNRNWTQEQIDLLTLISQTTALFLLKARDHEKTVFLSENLSNVLNNQDAWVYVMDPETFEMKYINQRTKEMAENIREGEFCYKVLMERDTPCENCPARALGECRNTEAVIENKHFGLKVRCRAASIKWDGEDACLITCHKIIE